MDERRETLNKIFENIDPKERELVDKLLDDVIFMECQMEELRKIPFIRIHPKDPTRQETTKAAKLYKEFSQSYMNAIRILCSLLHKVDTSAEDELLKKLTEF